MLFRPCIDIHNGRVKQIVGSTLRDAGDYAKENFVSEKDAAFYANLYKDLGLTGGHVIMLNPAGSDHYEATKAQALGALSAYPQGLMIGGGINADNAKDYIEAGASHVIVTSFVFRDGRIDRGNLDRLVSTVGKERIALDLSCRFSDGAYRVVTDRWQKITDETVTGELLEELSGSCDEFLVHAVDSEGKSAGIDEKLTKILAASKRPVCYAGGISTLDDIMKIKKAGDGRVDFTVGSALDIFGGTLKLEDVIECTR